MVQFKKIKLIGFKSFADKTEIPLTDGVTCIVGPNGCGKSNVADAIRWVLGEQSAKVMRGSQMMDVIFNGTEKRKKTSFCEVTLTFDNSNRMFDYDADEIEMTRRLYRDGTSEYLLNQQPSRMKILTGLLHGAGAAKEGYSIIGQGRIAQIMNSRPEERRSIFEEATGIVMFKDRKAEAERKLNYSRDNLFVFAQRMSEVERQLGPLSKQAENARKYNALYDTLRVNEINTYIFRHDGAAGERAKISARLGKLNDQLKQNNDRAAELLSEYEKCRSMLAGADDRLKKLNDERLEFTVGLERSTGESKVFKERANAVKYKLQQAQDDIVFAAKRIVEVDNAIKRCDEYAKKNGDRIEKLRVSCQQLQQEIDLLNEEIAAFELSTNEHRTRIFDAYRDLSEMKENIGSLTAKKQFLMEKLAEIDEAMGQLQADHDRLKAEYDRALKAQEELNAYLSEENTLMENAEETVKAASERVQTYVRRIYDAEAKIDALEKNLKMQKGLRDRFEGYVYSVRRLMSDANDNPRLASKILGLIADVVECDASCEVAIETAFGGAMQNVITQTREDAQFLIEYLKANRAGQVTFLPIDALRPRLEGPQIKSACKENGAVGMAIDLVHYDQKYENVIHYILGNTLICKDIASATVIARRYPRAFKIVTLDGDVIASSGSMTGGSRRENSANLLANERKIKDIEDDIAAAKHTLQTSEVKRAEAEKELENARALRAELEEKLQSARLELAAAKEKLSALMTTMADKAKDYTAYRLSKSEVERTLSQLDSEYSSTSEGASSLSRQSDQANSEIDTLSAENEKKVNERNEKNIRLNKLQVEMASLESAMRSNMETADRTRAERTALIEKVNNLHNLVPELEQQFNEWTERAARAALSQEEQVKLDELNGKISETEENKKKLNERVAEIDTSRYQLAEEIDELNGRVHAQELALQKIDSDLEFLQQRIEEEYNEDYEGCLKYKVDDFDVSAASSVIINCKRQITMLGTVNLSAIEDYEAVSARYEQMTAEKEDLEKAMHDLETALEDIRTEMLKKFDAGFNLINENFKRTFKELFGGGRAELQLDYTDCTDPLDAGVEIVACPPGKNLTKISLLSGGEQALTAIAILFAIIQMRPMPFCVLDEIEAALDDANVGRYASYLKKFAAKTQFIVITHRKPTMEKADVLFGVTMEEKGVSKIVSVKLSEVESRLGGDTVTD